MSKRKPQDEELPRKWSTFIFGQFSLVHLIVLSPLPKPTTLILHRVPSLQELIPDYHYTPTWHILMRVREYTSARNKGTFCLSHESIQLSFSPSSSPHKMCRLVNVWFSCVLACFCQFKKNKVQKHSWRLIKSIFSEESKTPNKIWTFCGKTCVFVTVLNEANAREMLSLLLIEFWLVFWMMWKWQRHVLVKQIFPSVVWINFLEYHTE